MPSTIEKPTGRTGRPSVRIDLATATDWLIAHGFHGFGQPAASTVHTTLAENPDAISDEPGLAGAVERARAAERHSFQLLREAIKSRNNIRVAATLENWREAAKALADLEKRLSHREQIEREVHDQTQQAVREWCDPKRAYIEAIPHAFASRLLNLKTSREVETVLADLVASLIKQLNAEVKFANEQTDQRP